MHIEKENFYVLTGGPGTGKTTLLSGLKQKGFTTVPEDARQIIKDQIKTNGDALPWKNREKYTALMLEASHKRFSRLSAKDTGGMVHFFDRGIPDALCYAKMIQLHITREMDEIARACRYNRKVFLLPPWREIYTTDDERKQSWEEAVQTYETMRTVYSKYGYETIAVPPDTIEKRVDFVVRSIGNHNKYGGGSFE